MKLHQDFRDFWPGPLPALDSGSGGRVILCLHGLFGGRQAWQEFMANLDGDYRVVVPELPLFYDWGWLDPLNPTIAQLREAVVAFCHQRWLTSVVLCGNSLGGQIALDLCRHHQDMVQALILVGAAGLSERLVGRPGYILVTREFVKEQARKTFFDPALVTEALVDDVLQRVGGRQQQLFLARLTKAASRFQVRDFLGEIKIPTLLVWGRQDQITPPEAALEFQRRLPHSRLIFLEHCGHAPHLEQPQAFAQAVKEFVQELEEEPGC